MAGVLRGGAIVAPWGSTMRYDRLRAFTLVELLVVIAIVGLLIAILLPSLTAARRSTRRVVCMSNLRALAIGVHSYEAAFRGVLPWEGYAEGDRPIRHLGRWNDSSQWFNACLAYAGYPPYHAMQQADLAGGSRLPREGDQSFLVCPESAPAVAGPKDDLVQDGYFMLWGLNAAGNQLDRRKTFWSYGYNTELDAGVEDRHSDKRVCLSQVRRPAETPILAEKLMRPDEHVPSFSTSVGQAAVSWRYFTTRHNQGGFLLFLDSHVGFFTLRELLDAPNAPEDYNQPGKVIWNPGGVAN